MRRILIASLIGVTGAAAAGKGQTNGKGLPAAYAQSPPASSSRASASTASRIRVPQPAGNRSSVELVSVESLVPSRVAQVYGDPVPVGMGGTTPVRTVAPTGPGPGTIGPTVIAPVPSARPITVSPGAVTSVPIGCKPVYLGKGIIGQPKAYVEGQPIRNFFRWILP